MTGRLLFVAGAYLASQLVRTFLGPSAALLSNRSLTSTTRLNACCMEAITAERGLLLIVAAGLVVVIVATR